MNTLIACIVGAAIIYLFYKIDKMIFNGKKMAKESPVMFKRNQIVIYQKELYDLRKAMILSSIDLNLIIIKDMKTCDILKVERHKLHLIKRNDITSNV
jgi:hypothetical protein